MRRLTKAVGACCPFCNHRPKLFVAGDWFWAECEQFRGDSTFAHHVAVTAKTLPGVVKRWNDAFAGIHRPPEVIDSSKVSPLGHVKSLPPNPSTPEE